MSDKNAQKGPEISLSVIALALQVGAAIFFLTDSIGEAMTEGGWMGWAEIIIALALVIGIVMSALHIRQMVKQGEQKDAALTMARGAFADLVQARFADWGLSRSEAEIALLSLKGYSIPEIAGLRGKAEGTVRSQLSQVYAKSGMDNRAALAASFIDDLLDEGGVAE